MSDAAAAEPAAGKKAGSNKLLLLGVLMFNVIIAGGLAYVVISGQKKEAPAKHAEGGKAGGEGEEEGGDAHGAKSKFGPLIDIGAFVANLGSPASKSYIKIAVQVEGFDEETKPKIESAIVPIRNECLLFLAGITPDQVVGQENIRALQETLLKRLTALLGKKTVKHVYFSEFVVQ